MNPLMKNIIVLTAMISMIIPLTIYAQPFLTSLVKNTSKPTFFVYTGGHTDSKYNIVIRVDGIVEGDTLYIYQISINGRSLAQYDPDALINGLAPSDALPIKITQSENTLVELTLTKIQAGQFIELYIHTSMGTVFQTIEI